MKKPKLKPIRICNLTKLTEEQMKYARKFIPTLRTRRNRFGADEEGMYHTCYCFINLLDGRIYAGKHTFNYDPKEKGWSNYHGSSEWLWRSMQVHGEENFRLLILKYFGSSTKAYQFESKLITEEMIGSKQCYNRQYGGKGFSSGSKHISYTLGIDPWRNSLANDSSKFSWFLANYIRSVHKQYPKFKRYKLSIVVNKALKLKKLMPNIKLNSTSVSSLLRKLKSGWVPDNDKEWLKFNQEILNGEHNFISSYSAQDLKKNLDFKVETKTYGCITINPNRCWNKKGTTESSKRTWWFSDEIYIFHAKFPQYKGIKLCGLCGENLQLKGETADLIVKKFLEGWVPKKDKNWKRFKAKG